MTVAISFGFDGVFMIASLLAKLKYTYMSSCLGIADIIPCSFETDVHLENAIPMRHVFQLSDFCLICTYMHISVYISKIFLLLFIAYPKVVCTKRVSIHV